jgi:phage tail sheath protein FI
MPFQVSPGINVTEVDLTTIVPAVSSTDGAIAGVFNWGPVNERVLVTNESNLVTRFGVPTNANPETFFTASSFLSYGNKLYVVRAGSANTLVSATANTATPASNTYIGNKLDYDNKVGNFDSSVLYVSKYPGDFGNSLRISVCDTANAFASTLNLVTSDVVKGSANGTFNLSVGSYTANLNFANTVGATNTAAAATTAKSRIAVNDIIVVGNSSTGTQKLQVSSIGSVVNDTTNSYFSVTFTEPLQLSSNVTNANTVTRYWEFHDRVNLAPGTSRYQSQFGNSAATDEIHVVVVDDNGLFTKVPGTILEVYSSLSRATDAKTADGATNYYKTVINQSSQYVWWANDRANAVSNTAVNLVNSTNDSALNLAFQNGAQTVDESNVSISVVASGYDLFASAEDVDISLVLQGKAIGANYTQLANYIVDNITTQRKDCVAFISPNKDAVVNNLYNETNSMVTFRNNCRDTSYGVLDSGYKYMYDRYNDIYRWVPLNGDIAGLCVRTDTTNDPWWSPAGFNRGQIKNIVKLAYNPNKANRDILYKNNINPVVTFPGQGTVLFGDKTMQSKPSAFDRINVRRLFIVLEKAISTAAKFTLFEFNDAFTRSQFKNLITPYLRDIKGRRGITDFLVVCDATNNTGEVIDRNEFIGDIYIKPARAINFIQLNFVAVRTGVQFSEVVGQF